MEYIIYGTAIHSVLEKNYKQKIESKIDLPLEELLEYWKVTFADLLAKENKKFNEDDIVKLNKE